MLTFITLLGCNGDKPEPTPQFLQAGSPMAGVAEGKIDVPLGTPMGGYSNRCFFLGGAGTVDDRETQYATAFSVTTGIQTSIMAEALWLDNGDQEWIMLTIDSIYSNDELVREVERNIKDATGVDVYGNVVISASHTHHAPANYSDQIHFYLGGDRYNEEIFQRYSKSLSDLAVEAFNSKSPAKIGFGVVEDWDPDNLVFRDRRPENDDLGFFEDINGAYKNPELWMLRVDDIEDNPMGVFFNFGIHGTTLGSSNSMFSVDAPGHLEFAFQERFDQPVVVGHFQGGGGDISPTGLSEHGHPYAIMEGISEFAVDTFYELWNTIPTSSKPFTIEVATRSITQGQEDIRVTRQGSVDLHYQAFQEDYIPDDQIFDSDGNIISPLDEFNTQYGAVFCGYDEPFISTATIASMVYPYDGCIRTDMILNLLTGVFQLNDYFPDGIPLPMPSSTKAQTSSLRLGPVSIVHNDGSIVEEDVFMGFFPGEVTSYFLRHYRDRVKEELGFSNVILGDYSQDHEGYLLIPEDWLLGGYEPNINIWGPLQAEHIMEGNLEMSELLNTDVLENPNPTGEYDSTSYPDRPLPMLVPDSTPLAGTLVSEVSEDFFIPLDTQIQVQPDPVLPRVQGLAQFVWEGGDPAVDNPHVILEKLSDQETWEEVVTDSGRPIDETLPDILLAHTPTPIEPFDIEQDHQWWVGWQTIAPTSSNDNRMGLPLGVYRFHIYGQQYIGSESTYPWTTREYEVISASFNVVAAELDIQVHETTSSVSISLEGPSWGYRLIDIEGSAVGDNPPMGATVTVLYTDGLEEVFTVHTVFENRIVIENINIPNIESISAEDVFGNQGVWWAE